MSPAHTDPAAHFLRHPERYAAENGHFTLKLDGKGSLLSRPRKDGSALLRLYHTDEILTVGQTIRHRGVPLVVTKIRYPVRGEFTLDQVRPSSGLFPRRGGAPTVTYPAPGAPLILTVQEGQRTRVKTFVPSPRDEGKLNEAYVTGVCEPDPGGEVPPSLPVPGEVIRVGTRTGYVGNVSLTDQNDLHVELWHAAQWHAGSPPPRTGALIVWTGRYLQVAQHTAQGWRTGGQLRSMLPAGCADETKWLWTPLPAGTPEAAHTLPPGSAEVLFRFGPPGAVASGRRVRPMPGAHELSLTHDEWSLDGPTVPGTPPEQWTYEPLPPAPEFAAAH